MILTGCGIRDVDCYTGYGSMYEGKVNTTPSGSVCKYWEKQTDNTGYRDGESNFCRNPGPPTTAGHDGPWCFTTSKHTHWEACDVRKCEPCDKRKNN